MIHFFFSIEFSFSSLSEMQNARGIMDVLAEMLSALEPGNKEVDLKCQESLEIYTRNNTIFMYLGHLN